MFRLTEPSSGQIQNIVLVHSVSAHIMGSHTVYKIIYNIYNFVILYILYTIYIIILYI